nr:PREDICTED: dynein heavy chain 9, axonemal-like [Latimeria chalumnae]|eukprot:XP_014350011.1 PREDICTED: dynein heavy chain 9, axonemal-like [Latimeria chalumnae]
MDGAGRGVLQIQEVPAVMPVQFSPTLCMPSGFIILKVVVPVLANGRNHQKWPHVVSQDVMRHVHTLKSNVFVVIGQVRGKTLLPLPTGAEKVEDVACKTEKNGDLVDKTIVHAIESAIIQWSHQVQEVLKRDSSEPLLQGRNPNPTVELEFWKNRYADLECIYDQLQALKVRKMAELLERMNSTYFPAFKAMFRGVVAALNEARDINLHMKPLQRHLEDVENVEFSEVKPLIGPLLHVVCLIWSSSKHYNTPGRIIVLLQEICNLLIQQTQNYLNPEDILKGETEESLVKVHEALDVLHYFKQTFEGRRENLSQYYKEGQEVREWDFTSLMVFARMDCFLRRLETLEDLLVTALDILKLEKIEFGGIRGKALSQQVLNMYEEFQEVFKVFSERSYDCLDIANTEFEDDVRGFQQRVEDMDRRLGTIFCQAFEDASGLEHAFKLLDMFGSLLERPLIAADAYDKYPRLITVFDRDLDNAKLIYNEHMQKEAELGYPPVNRNMPLVAGGLRWAQELRERIRVPFNNFRHITHP